MNFAMAQSILGLMLMIFSLTMLPPIGVSLLYDDGHWHAIRDFGRDHRGRTALLLWLPVPATRAATCGCATAS